MNETTQIKPDKKGYYRCPYSCGGPRYPRPKWKTLAGIEAHLSKCPKSPAAIERRKRKDEELQAEFRRESEAAISACQVKIGDTVHFVNEIVTRPTHEWRGTRSVRVRYEPEMRFESGTGIVTDVFYQGYGVCLKIGYLEIPVRWVRETSEQAHEDSVKRTREYAEWLQQCRDCRD